MAGSRAARLAAFGFLALASLLAVGAARQADAGGEDSRAVVIVGSTPICITFNGTINGVDALGRAGVQATTAGFGGLGSGVCAIEGQGCPASACFQCALPDYWHYFRANSGGAFSSSPVGASSTHVGDGDIEAWVWGSTVGPPAVVHVDDVCGPAPPPTSAPTVPPVSARPPTGDPGSSATPSPGPGQSSGPAAAPGAQDRGPTTAGPTASGPPTTEAAESSGAGRTTITAPVPSPAPSADTNTDDESALAAALASDQNLASAPSIDGYAESSVAAWLSVAGGVVLVAAVVGWALWRRRTRVG